MCFAAVVFVFLLFFMCFAICYLFFVFVAGQGVEGAGDRNHDRDREHEGDVWGPHHAPRDQIFGLS